MLLAIVLLARLGSGAPFAEVPPVLGAYTLRGGEMQIGLGMQLALFPRAYGSAGLSVDYGLTPWLQLGATLTASPYMGYTASGKVRLDLGPGICVGIPMGVSFVDAGFGIEFGWLSCVPVLSTKVGGLGLHGAFGLALSRLGTGFVSWFMADLDLRPTV